MCFYKLLEQCGMEDSWNDNCKKWLISTQVVTYGLVSTRFFIVVVVRYHIETITYKLSIIVQLWISLPYPMFILQMFVALGKFMQHYVHVQQIPTLQHNIKHCARTLSIVFLLAPSPSFNLHWYDFSLLMGKFNYNFSTMNMKPC